MRQWRKQIRLAMIAVAGFVLLVTVLPQVASGIGLGALANRLDGTVTCSGSSGSGSSGSVGSSDSSSSCCSGSSGSSGSVGSGSSGCVNGPGTVTGTVTVTGAPAGFTPGVLGAGVCPEPDPSETLCAAPQYALANGPDYTLSLDPGSYVLWGFYENSFSGGAFLSAPQVVTVESGGTLVVDTSVPYAKPATLSATVTVTGLPAGVLLTSATVVLCPAGITFDPNAQPPLPCATGNTYLTTPSSGPVQVDATGLPAGTWTAYAGYCTQFGCATGSAAPKPVVTTAGRTTKAKLSVAYQVPPNGLLSASVLVSGAPAGFTPSTGLEACQQSGLSTYCEGVGGTGPFQLLLTDGTWFVTGYYSAPGFGNSIVGPTEIVDIQGGQTSNLVLDAPYQVLGGVTGTIKIAGLPAGVHPTGYAVTACPSGVYSGPYNPIASLECVYETSGSNGYVYGAADTRRLGRNAHRTALGRAAGAKINTFALPTLTPGSWDVSVDYTTPYGTYGSPTVTTVQVTAGVTSKVKVKVPYQQPFLGLVTGTVQVTNAPFGAYSDVVRACDSAPTATSCTDEVDATPGATGAYQLPLFAGTWWVQGEADNYAGSTVQTVISPPQQIAVTAGQHYKANFLLPLL